jgi:hypothetical protein
MRESGSHYLNELFRNVDQKYTFLREIWSYEKILHSDGMGGTSTIPFEFSIKDPVSEECLHFIHWDYQSFFEENELRIDAARMTKI